MIRPALLAQVLAVTLASSPMIGHADEETATEERFGFLIPGVTTRIDVLMRLGRPTMSFEQDRLLVFRVTRDKRMVVPVQSTAFLIAAQELIVEFDTEGRIHRFAAVREMAR